MPPLGRKRKRKRGVERVVKETTNVPVDNGTDEELSDSDDSPTCKSAKNSFDRATESVDKVLGNLIFDVNDQIKWAEQYLDRLLEKTSVKERKARKLARKAPQFHIPARSTVDFVPKCFNNAKMKARRVKEFRSSFEKSLVVIGTVEQQLAVLHSYVMEAVRTNSDSALPLVGAFGFPVKKRGRQLDLQSNLREIFQIAVKNQCSNDTRSFFQTVLTAIIPSNLEYNRRTVALINEVLGLKYSKANSRRIEAAISARKRVIQECHHFPSLMQLVTGGNHHTRYTSEFIRDIHEWITLKCDLLAPSPNQKDSVMVKDVITGVASRQQKLYLITSVAELLVEMTKPVHQGGFAGAYDEDGSLRISDTSLREFMPRNVSRLTNCQRQVCGCSVCLISKGFVQTLNAWETTHLKRLRVLHGESRGRRQTMLKEKADTMEEICWNEGVHRFKHPRHAVLESTCPPVGDTGVHKMCCALELCDHCPALVFPPVMLDRSDDAPEISFEIYDYHSTCTVHKSLPRTVRDKAPGYCSPCKEINDDPTNHDRTGRFSRKKHLTRKRTSIGDFIDDYYVPQMKRYRMHTVHVGLLGKEQCVKDRRAAYQEIPGAAYTQRDYADRLKQAMNMEFSSTVFGETNDLSMEGVVVICSSAE